MKKIMPKNALHKEFLDVVFSLVNKKIREEPISLIILGGSVARGDMEKHSDIDIAYYVPKKELHKFSRSFYKYLGKYIEDSYFAIEELEVEELIAESVVVYDPKNIIKNKKIQCNEKNVLSANFKKSITKGKLFLKLAEKYYNKGLYKESLIHLLSMQSYAFMFLHSLPPRFNMPFPTFKLYNSIKKISKELGDPEIYKISTNLFNASENFIEYFEKGYNLMHQIQKKLNPNKKNYGFFDLLKIKYNIKYMEDIVKKHPKVFASRFAIGCMIDWAWNQKNNFNQKEIVDPYMKELNELMLKIFDINKITKEFVKEKLEITQKLNTKIDILIKKGLL